MAGKRLDWTREEIIVALDLYVASGAYAGGSIPGDRSQPVAEVSAFLKRLNAYPPELQGDKYRNVDGVYLKLTNFRAIQTEGLHGMNAYSQLDAAVFREYEDDLVALREEAEAIRLRLAQGILLPPAPEPTMQDVEIERQHTEAYMMTPSGEPRPAQRAEQRLVLRYQEHLEAKGVHASRKRYRPAGEIRPIFSDVWVEERSALLEAKNSDNRDALRQAIGQLYDYRRFHEGEVHLAVLLPYRPNDERLDLLRSAGIAAVWPHGRLFRDTAQGRFV